MEKMDEGDTASSVFSFFIMMLIFLNVLAVILETEKRFHKVYSYYFYIFEIFSISVFTIEYILRLWSITADERYSHPVRGRLRFALTPMALVDLAVILPFYLPLTFALDLRFIRALRFFRLFRLFKMGRYIESHQTLINVLKQKKEELIISVFLIVVLLIVTSSLIYFFEHDAQPEAFSSIPVSMLWGVSALATGGLGDIHPVTMAGKVFGAVISILGIGLLALPSGIIASGFVEEFQNKRNKKTVCPHCGKEIDII